MQPTVALMLQVDQTLILLAGAIQILMDCIIGQRIQPPTDHAMLAMVSWSKLCLPSFYCWLENE
jgi:hypothetical protein